MRGQCPHANPKRLRGAAMRTALAFSLFVAGFVGACQVNVKDTQTPEPEEIEPEPTSTAAQPEPTAPPAAQPTAEADGKLDKLKGQKICTQMGCMDGFHVDVEPQAWAKGKYKLVISADDKTTTCEGSLPLPACDKGKALACKGDVEVMIGESGCALPPEQQGFGPFNFRGNPKQVKIAISRGGKEVAKSEFSPAYKTVQPNGPECGPTCNSASEKMTVK